MYQTIGFLIPVVFHTLVVFGLYKVVKMLGVKNE